MDSSHWYDDSLAYHRERDAQANAMSSPPRSERLRWPAFWLVDFVTPEVLPSTIARLKASPLNASDRFAQRGELSHWLEEARTAPLASGYINLPLCVHSTGGWSPAVVCDGLPEEVESAQLTVFALTPGLQAVFVCFYLRETAQAIPQEILSRARQTEAVLLQDGAVTFRLPSQQKSDELDLVRQALHSAAAAWLGRSLPGVFSRDDDTWAQTPSCDYFLTRSRVPYAAKVVRPTRDSIMFDDYMRVMGLHGGTWDAYQTEQLPGFRLGFPDSGREGSRGLTLAARERDVTHFAEAMYAGPLTHSTAHKLHYMLDDLLLTWALHQLADHHHADLSEQRDSWNRDEGGLAKATSRARQAALTMGKVADSRAIARDLLSVTEPNHRLQMSPLTLLPVSPVMRKHASELHAGLVATLRRKAAALDVLASDIEAMTIAGSNLDAAAANLSLQGQLTTLTKWLVAFTFMLIALTGVLIFQAYLAAK